MPLKAFSFSCLLSINTIVYRQLWCESTQGHVFWRGINVMISFFFFLNQKLQLNLHEANILFRYLSHHLTKNRLLISGLFPVLVSCDHKIVLHWYENQNKNNLVIILYKSWETVRNQLTISCQIVANISKLYFCW